MSNPRKLSAQSTLSNHFSSSQSKPPKARKHLPDQSVLADHAPPSKRVKLDAQQSPLSRSAKVEAMPASKFPSSGPQRTFIDLTTSDDRGVKTPGLRLQTGAKRITIKNLHRTPRLDPQEYFREKWAEASEALNAIFEGREPEHSREELYRGVENICKQNGGRELSGRLVKRCYEQITQHIKPHVLAYTNRESFDLLKAIVESWKKWSDQVFLIRKIFSYLDQSYLLNTKGEVSIQIMTVRQFRKGVFLEQRIRTKALEGICDLIDNERKGRTSVVDPNLLNESLNMVRGLDVYRSNLESKLIAESELFYTAFSEDTSSSLDLASYLKAIKDLSTAEQTRCDHYGLDQSTRFQLAKLRENIFLSNKLPMLTEPASIFKLLDRRDEESLQLLYAFLKDIMMQDKLKKPWADYIIEQGTTIVSDLEREDQMVIHLLELKQTLTNILMQSFRKNDDLGVTLRNSFATFINARKQGTSWTGNNSKVGEMIAKYMDMLLRGGVKAVPQSLGGASSQAAAKDDGLEEMLIDEDAELESQLTLVLDLFRFIEGKDVFEAFYKKDLARRLLMARSASADAERSMLAKLRSECGAGFTHNLEQMFKDVDLAREEMASYKVLQRDRGSKDKIDLSVNILSASAWPSYPDIPVNIPSEIASIIDKFDRHYKSQHTGRRLTWKHALAHCIVRASFPKGTKELVVSSFQAIILYLFNGLGDSEKLSYREISSATGLTDAELERTLQSLACAKFRVLTKTPKGRDVKVNDVFQVNLGFSDAKYRVKINQIQLKETKEENKQTHERVSQDRQYEAQAAIVRIMKSRKAMSHVLLVAEVIEQTRKRGQLTPQEIKKNIDKLIEKDYIERNEKGGYTYLA